MQELGKFSLIGNVLPNGVEKYMSFSINNKSSLIDSSQFLSSSLDSLVKNLNKDDFKYSSQDFDNNVLVKQKGVNPYEYMRLLYSLKIYGLCPIHYLNAPALSWDAMRKWNSNLFQILIFTYSLKKVREVEFLILVIDTTKKILSI